MIDALFRVWLTFTLLVFFWAGLAAFWAWKAGQFRDQERARKLALYARVEDRDGEE